MDLDLGTKAKTDLPTWKRSLFFANLPNISSCVSPLFSFHVVCRLPVFFLSIRLQHFCMCLLFTQKKTLPAKSQNLRIKCNFSLFRWSCQVSLVEHWKEDNVGENKREKRKYYVLYSFAILLHPTLSCLLAH